MKWHNLALAAAGAGLLAACQTAHTDAPTTEEAAALEAQEPEGPTLDERLAALEEQVAEARVAVAEAEARASRAERRATDAQREAARPAPAPQPAPVRTASADIEPVAPAPAPRRPAPAPRPTPRPQVVVPSGTRLAIALETPLSSESSRVGDRVVARVESATAPDGDVALPGGAYVEGRVTEVKASGKVSGRARLTAHFDTIVVRGERYDLDASDLFAEAESTRKRDAAMVGGGAAAGGIIGGIAGGKGGFGKGVLIGGATGAAAVLATEGKEIDLPAGSTVRIEVFTTIRF